MEEKYTIIDIAVLDRNQDRQGRAAKDESVIEEYAERMNEGDTFPPIVVFYDGETYRLADGFLRTEARERAGFQTIKADVKQGGAREALLYAMGANKSHGLRRTNADKKKVTLRILRDPEWSTWSNNEIALHCGVSGEYVRRLRNDLEAEGEIEPVTERTVKRGDQEYIMNVDNIGQSQSVDGSGSNGNARQNNSPFPPDLDDGYDEDDLEGWEAGKGNTDHRPLQPMPEMEESWMNAAPTTVRAEMSIQGVVMESGEINIGNGRHLEKWPTIITIPQLGMELSLSQTDTDDVTATTIATYRLPQHSG